MMNAHRDVCVATVGTSLLGVLRAAPESPLGAALKGRDTPGASRALLALEPSDRRCGAEVNSLHRIVEQGFLSARRRLVLLRSDTEDGALVGRILSAFFKGVREPLRFEAVEDVVVSGLRDDMPRRFASEGLRNLVRAVAEVVRREGAERVLINATGGYKAQIAFAGMIGQAMGIPVCYLFERFPEVIALPPQPVSLDLTFWLENADVFYACEAMEGPEGLAGRDPRFETLIEEETVDGKPVVALSAVGTLFHESLKSQFRIQAPRLLPPASGREPRAKIPRRTDHHFWKVKGIEGFLGAVAAVPYVARLRPHYDHPGLPRPTLFRLKSDGADQALEGVFSDGRSCAKFIVETTAKTRREREAALADLNDRLAKGEF